MNNRKKKKLERILGVAALLTIIAAWIAGALRQEADREPFLKKALPGAEIFKPVSAGIYAGYAANDFKESVRPVIGYTAIGTANGYGGPMRVAVGVDLTGNISGITIIDHKETIPFFQKVLAKEFPGSLRGKSYSHSFLPGDDVDSVSGATLSLNALLNSTRQALRQVAGKTLNLPAAPGKAKPLRFGLPELILLLLSAAGFASYSKKIKQKPKIQKNMRRVSLIIGLLLLGFVYTIPLSIININSLLLGYWPDWHTHLYWYLLLAGGLLPLILIEKSPYCDTFCPFGSTQEVLKVIGGAKPRMPFKYHSYMQWIQRSLAWAAIVLALFFRSPAHVNVEVFGTFFNLTGTYFQFALLAVVLVAALFITRPWCNYLCPLRAVADYLRSMRKWMIAFRCF
jgi:Na+-translocating ferredoxin:NAD+ oxidoreductase RnfG subunit